MSTEQNKADLLAAAKAAFALQDQMTSIEKRTVSGETAWHQMFDPYSLVGNFINRGQAFGLLKKDTDFEAGIQIEEIESGLGRDCLVENRIVDCLTIQMNFPIYEIPSGLGLSVNYRIYRDPRSGEFYTGLLFGSTLSLERDTSEGRSKLGLSEGEVYEKVYEWAQHFATHIKKMQAPYLSTMSNEDLPSPSIAYRVGSAFFKELGAYLNRTFG